MGLTLGEVDSILRPLVRGIDKRADYSAQFEEGTEGDAGVVLVKLVMRRKSTIVRIPLDAVTAATDDLVRRNQLRTRLKQALDRMLFVAPPPPLPARIEPATTEGFFRSPPGGARRR
jgi:hypothetical protein